MAIGPFAARLRIGMMISAQPELNVPITAPTLVVVGEDDMIAGPVCADAIMRELPDGRLVTIRESGHFVYLEQPAAFRAALTGFAL